jgi:hypothetical protein
MDKPFFNVTQAGGARYDETPQSLSSIAEARDIFEHHSRMFYHEFHKIINTTATFETFDILADFLHRYTPLLEQWSVGLDKFEQGRSRLLTAKESMGLKILQMYRYSQSIILDYDKFAV